MGSILQGMAEREKGITACMGSGISQKRERMKMLAATKCITQKT